MKNKLRFWRQERGISQFDLSAITGIPRYLIQLFELGVKYPEKTHQQNLASALGKTAKDIFPKECS